MKVCIAEKPSVAKEIAAVLGAKSRKDGYFEGNGYAVTWTFGHFCTLKPPEDYDAAWKKWEIHTLPMLPEKFETKLISDKGVKKQFGFIKKLLKSAEAVINCGDAAQEGELIQRWVLKEAGFKGKVLRLWISSLTSEAIREGFRNLKDAAQFDNLYYAGSSRAIGDWLLGLNATRLYTLKYGGYKQVISIGRVQTPTLAMLVERHKEIENFVPQPFWELQTLYREIVFNYEKGRFLKKEDGEILLKKVENKPFVILSVEKKEGREYPPRLFDLTSLQVFCNKRFGYSADQTLKIVQKLYEQKVVSYPRVDTTYLPNDIYPKVHGILSKMAMYSQLTAPLLGKNIRKSSKVFNDGKVTDHHAIIPTGFEKNLLTNEQNVYDAIARHFIAAFYPDCIVANTTVVGEAASVKFKATGKEILKEGWRVVLPKPKKQAVQKTSKSAAEDDENILPEFVEGETSDHLPALVEKQTQPPKVFTEATLLRAMETAGKKVDDETLRDLMKANGIGRPSTRAAIIETLFKRNYIRRNKKQIIPTEIGIQLIDTIENKLLKSAELTGQWEKKLREIEDGAYSPVQFIAEMKSMVSNLVEEVSQAKNRPRLVAAIPKSAAKPSKSKSAKTIALAEMSCPKCRSGKLLKGKTAYGCSRWKEGCSFRLPFSFMGKNIPETQLARLMKHGSTINMKGFKESGKSLAGILKFNKEFELNFQTKGVAGSPKVPAKKQPEKVSCPKCGKGTVIKGKKAYGCSLWQSGCDFRFPFEEIRKRAGDRPLTAELVKGIIAGG